MAGILAIDTATEACSVALYRDGEYLYRYELTPRQHSQRLFGMLRELLPSGKLADHGIDAIAYGCGPGSFTGLRIVASAVQGLAYTNNLPALAVSTLACQAQTALRLGCVAQDGMVLSTLDARINEVYYAVFGFEDGLAVVREEAVAASPALIAPDAGTGALQAVGSGCNYVAEFAPPLRDRLQSISADLLPDARDLVPLALDQLRRGEIQHARQVQPVYVRDEINWKKIPEQGRKA